MTGEDVFIQVTKVKVKGKVGAWLNRFQFALGPLPICSQDVLKNAILTEETGRLTEKAKSVNVFFVLNGRNVTWTLEPWVRTTLLASD